jgi:hypothetical protein
VLSAFSAMLDQATVGVQPQYTSALKREVEEQVEAPSMSRVSRRFRRDTTGSTFVCNAVPDIPKLNFQYIITNMSTV